MCISSHEEDCCYDGPKDVHCNSSPTIVVSQKENVPGILYNEVANGLYNEIIDDFHYAIPNDFGRSGETEVLHNTPNYVYNDILFNKNTDVIDLYDEVVNYEVSPSTSMEIKALQIVGDIKTSNDHCLSGKR